MVNNKHQITTIIRDNSVLHKCDECGQLVAAEKTVKVNKSLGEFVYCNECMKKLYPNYKKIYIQNFNAKIAKEMRDTLARKEYRR